MPTMSSKGILSLIVCATLSCSWAADLPIGVIASGTHFTLDNTESAANTTVPDGGSIRTGRFNASIRLNGGATVIISPNSHVIFSGGRLLLEQGSVRAVGYPISASNLRIDPRGMTGFSVWLRGQLIKVAAPSGNVRVFNAGGVNIANLIPGDTLEFRSQDTVKNTLSSLTGCVSRQNNSYVLMDVTSKVSVVLHGRKVNEGEAVRVTGRLAAASSSSTETVQTLEIAALKVLPGGCKALAAKTAEATAVVAGGAGAGAASATGTAGAGGAAGAASAAGAGTAGGAAAGAAAGGAISGTVVAGVAVAAGAGTAAGLATVSSTPALSNGR